MAIAYLSAAWADGLTAAANADHDFIAALKGKQASMTATVTNTPSGEDAVYAMVSTGAAFAITLGQPENASDVELVAPYDIAVALAQGTTTPPRALMTGRVKTSGNVAKAMALAPAMKRLAGISNGIGVQY